MNRDSLKHSCIASENVRADDLDEILDRLCSSDVVSGMNALHRHLRTTRDRLPAFD